MARPFAEVVRVKNVSRSGAVLLGVHTRLCAGQLLDVQHGSQIARFKIVWASSGEAGIESLPSEPCIWDASLSKTLNPVGAG